MNYDHTQHYDHTQYGPLHWILLGAAMLVMVCGLLAGAEFPVEMIVLTCAGLMFFLALAFQYLQVRDEGDYLSLRYGPLRLFGKSIPYASIVDAQRDRSTVLDGWGIHWVPGRGWTYNLWGFDCAKLTLEGGKVIRVGSDDAENLVQAVRQKAGLA